MNKKNEIDSDEIEGLARHAEAYCNQNNNLNLFISDLSQRPTNFSFTSINTWYNIILIKENSVYKLYVNGVLTSTINNALIPRNANSMTIGSATGIRFFKGVLDDFCIYNRALTGTEIQTLYRE